MIKEKTITKDDYAILYYQQWKFWQLCTDSNWPADMKQVYRDFSAYVDKAAKRTRVKPLNICYSGFCEDTSHHDIDKALKAKFKSKVRVDSESGQFFAYSNEAYLFDICEWLEQNYPTLSITRKKVVAIKNPYFENWNAAKAHCIKHGLEVNLPTEALDIESYTYTEMMEQTNAAHFPSDWSLLQIVEAHKDDIIGYLKSTNQI